MDTIRTIDVETVDTDVDEMDQDEIGSGHFGAPSDNRPKDQMKAVANSTSNQEGQNKGGQTAPKAAEAMDKAKEQAHQVISQTQQKASHMVDKAREQITSQVASQKEKLAIVVESVADSLKQTSSQLQEKGQTPVANYMTTVAEQVDRVAAYVFDHDLNEIASDTGAFARKQPTVFLGGAFILGILAARFLKSSRQAV